MSFQDNLRKLKEKKELAPKHVIKQPQLLEFEIYTFDLNEHIDPNYVASLCKSYDAEKFKERLDNVNAKSTEYIKLRHTNLPEFENLFSVVENKIKLIWKLPYTFMIDHIWLTIYAKGDSTRIHNHGAIDLACVYYASVPKDSAPLVIPTIGSELRITPKPGMLVVMPGKCDHLVPKSEHDGERIIVALNLVRNNFLETNE